MNQLLTREAETLPSFIFGSHQESDIQESFNVDSEEKAAWAASKVLAAERRIQMRHDLASKYRTRIDEWETSANSADERTIDSLKGMLRLWVETSLRKQGRIRSIKLLGATVGLRKKPDKVDILDVETALKYCEQALPEAVVIKKDLSKTVLKTFLVHGRDIPGTFLVEGDDELTVKEGV